MVRETWNQDLAHELAPMGLPAHHHQDSIVYSRRGVIRGLRIQDGQSKIVQCVLGAIQSVCIDLRPDSANRGKTYSLILRAEGPTTELLYVPQGFAHGFLALENAMVTYKCTTPWNSKSAGVNPLASGVKWIVQREPGAGINGIVSADDQALPSLVDYLQRPV